MISLAKWLFAAVLLIALMATLNDAPMAQTAGFTVGSGQSGLTRATRTNDFLNSLGINTQVQSYGSGAAYTNGSGMVTDLNNLGVRVLRDGSNAATSGAQLSAMTTLANAGFHWTIIPTNGGGSSFTFNQSATITALKTIDGLASPHALLDVEEFNEPGNFMPTTGCGTSWTCTATADAAYYTAAKADGTLGSLPVWSISEAGAQTTNTGLQFLSNGGTNYANVFNIHIYPYFNGAVGFYDPGSAPLGTPSGNHDQFLEQWDQDFGPSTLHGYAGNAAGVFTSGPKVVTEFGLSTAQVNARTKAVNMVNGYLDAYFTDGFQRAFAYELYEEGDGYGFYTTTATPTTAATYMRNFTTPLLDTGATAATFSPGSLTYTLSGMPANSHSTLMQKSNGHFELTMWVDTTNYTLGSGPIVIGTTNATLSLTTAAVMNVYDDTVSGTSPTQTLTSTSATIPLSDHAVTVDIATTGGHIIAPNGTVWIGAGVDVHDANLGAAASGTYQVTTTFPGTNIVRVYVGGYGTGGTNNNYPAPSSFATAVTTLTNAGIVVEFHNASNSNNTGGGGAQGVIFTGTLRTYEHNWYAAMAAYYKSNPYVWFGTDNEPSACYPDSGGNAGTCTGGSWYSSGPKTLSGWESDTYTAVRNAGNTAPFVLEPSGNEPTANGGNGSLQTIMDQSYYTPMTNVIWDPHYYSYIAGYSSTQSVQNSSVAAMITTVQTITSADGTVPVMFGEYGPVGNGGNNGFNATAAVEASGVSTVAWAWDEQATVGGPSGDPTGVNTSALISGGTVTNPWGTNTQAHIAKNNMIVAPAALAATQSTATNLPGLSAQSPNPSDTMTFTGTSTLSGTLSAVGAGGNGTATVTYTGSLTGLNTLLGTMTFKDAVVENPTLTFTVHDAHSNSGSATTAVTVTAGTGGGGGVSPPVSGCTTTTCTGSALPSGYLNVSGNQIKSASGTNVRLACAVYGGAAGALADFQAIRAAGFNCVRIDWRDVYVASSGTGSGPPIATLGLGSITDASGNVFTLSASGVATEAVGGSNPQPMAGGSGTMLIEQYNSQVLFESVGCPTPPWYTWNGSNFVGGASTPATLGSIAITSGSGGLMDCARNIYTITGGGAQLLPFGGSVAPMAGGSAMTQAELYNGVIYFNAGTNWYTWSGSAFVSATAPPPPGTGSGVTPPSGCNSLTQITSCVANATTANLAVIFNHLGNEVPASGSACLTRQQNGLWFDSGTDSGGSDGCGTSGTVTAAIFQTNTVNLLKAFAGNTTVIGWEFHNEPLMSGSFTGTGSPAIPPVNWGGGGPTDIQAACGTVGAAVFAQNPGVIEFCPGPINNTGTLLLDGVTSTSFSGITTTNFSDLSGVAAHPVTGFSAAKSAYSIHLFPCNVQNTSPDEPVAGIAPIWSAYFGYLEKNGTAPVVNLSVGCSCDGSNGQSADDAAFMTRWVSYANGLTTGGPAFSAGQQGMGNAWYNWGNFASSNPNGLLNPDGTLKGSESGQNGGQNSYWSQLLQGSLAAPSGSRPLILIFGQNDLAVANDNFELSMAQ